MNFEKAAMMGKLAELKEKRRRFEAKFDVNARVMRRGLNTMLTAIRDIPMDELSVVYAELEVAWMEIAALNREIAKIEKELE